MIFSQKMIKRAIFCAAFLIAGANLISVAKADACDEYRACVKKNCGGYSGNNKYFCQVDCATKHSGSNCTAD